MRILLPSELQAAGMPAALETAAAAVEFKAAGEGAPNAPPRFAMMAYNGGRMRPKGFTRDVVLDITGYKLSSQTLPVYRDHDRTKILGHTERIDVAPRAITAEGVLSGANEHAREARESAAAGFPWKASVGTTIDRMEFYAEHETATANGQAFKGPVYVIREATAQEISFVSIAGDPTTRTTVAATRGTEGGTEAMDRFQEWLEAMGFTGELSDRQRQVLEAQYETQLEAAVLAAAGPELARTLRGLIDGRAGEQRPRHEVLAGLTAAGSIDMTPDGLVAAAARSEAPARETLTAFARELECAADTLTAAAERDRGPASRPNPGNQGGDDPVRRMRQSAAAEARRIQRVQQLTASHPDLQAQAIDEGWDETRTELEVLRAGRPGAHVGGQAPTASGYAPAALEAALCLSLGMDPEVAGCQAAHLEATSHLAPDRRYEARTRSVSERDMNTAMGRDYRGLTLHALMDAVLLQAGRHYRGSRKSSGYMRTVLEAERELQAASGFSTISLSGILSNIANKALIASYEAVEAVWPLICAIRSHNDFKTHTRYRLDASGAFRKVGPDGELKHVGMTETSFTNRLDTHGAIIALTRQMQIDDDLDAFAQIPTMIGRMSAVKVEEEVFKLLLSNPSSFFSAGNANLLTGAGSALSITGLTTAKSTFRNKVDPNGKAVLISPRILLVPTTLETTADDLHVQTTIQTLLDGSGDPKVARNPHTGLYRPVTTPYLNNTAITDTDGNALSGQSDTAWYLLADPAVRAAIAVATLNGRRMPTIESDETDFNTLGMQWRGYHDFGVGVEDPAAALKSAGA